VDEAKVVVGESAVTVAPFSDSAGRPSQPTVVLWESLDEEELVKCWTMIEQEKGWVVWCRANPGKTDKGKQDLKNMAAACSQVSASRSRLTAQTEKKLLVETCLHLPAKMQLPYLRF
jgi:hypothetical protein